MSQSEKIINGLTYENEEVVTMEKSAIRIGSGDLEVYSTPSMIALMEKTAMLSVAPFLDQGDSTVGGFINISHLRPTAIGKKVKCSSRITDVKEKKIEFEVEVYEGETCIGKGSHIRFVINKTTFMNRL